MKIALLPCVTVSKSFKFDAAHYLPGHPTCGKVHGHTWSVDVNVAGPVHPQAGVVLDFAELSHHVVTVVEELDHSLLNEIATLRNPTAEHIAAYICSFLCQCLLRDDNELEMVCVSVQEGMGGQATVTGVYIEEQVDAD